MSKFLILLCAILLFLNVTTYFYIILHDEFIIKIIIMAREVIRHDFAQLKTKAK